jgi:hypothetical protein
MPAPIISYERVVFNTPPPYRTHGPEGGMSSHEEFSDSADDHVAHKVELVSFWGTMKHTAAAITGACSCPPSGGGGGGSRRGWH